MRVWTIQPASVWEAIQERRVLHVDEARLNDEGYVPGLYRWLVKQLERRVPGYPGTLPWWVYCEKPDLRKMRHDRPAGSREVRLELEPAEGLLVTFPIWAWDTVYACNYLAATREEHDDWMAAMREAVPDEDTWPLPDPWRGQLEASWERLFSPGLPRRPWDEFSLGRKGEREGVLGCLRLEEVRRVTPFIGCFRRHR